MTSLEELALVETKSEYIEAFNFEVYNIYETTMAIKKFRPVLYVIIGLYLLGVYYGQRWMKGRRAFELKIPLFLWNLGLAVFSFVATLRLLPELLYMMSLEDGIYHTVCSAPYRNFATSFWLLMFFLSKILELGDTAFIILRKQKLITLHWFHHVSILGICWIGYESQESVGRLMVLNTFVHSFMYSYYALKALKIKIPRSFSKALTILQITQLIVGLILTIRGTIFLGESRECRMNKELHQIGISVVAIFVILFLNFFRKAYSRKIVFAKKLD